MGLLSKTWIYEYRDRLRKIDEGTIFKVVFNRSQIKEEIIYLNTQKQLFELGVNSRGENLGEYSPVTKAFKQAKGQPTDRITLKDTGEFYRSFRVFVQSNQITIVANPVKDDSNLFEDFGTEILGLTPTSIENLKPLVIENYKQYLRQLLGRN